MQSNLEIEMGNSPKEKKNEHLEDHTYCYYYCCAGAGWCRDSRRAQVPTPSPLGGGGYGMMGGTGYGTMGGTGSSMMGNFTQNGGDTAWMNNMHQWMLTNGGKCTTPFGKGCPMR